MMFRKSPQNNVSEQAGVRMWVGSGATPGTTPKLRA